MSAPAPVSTGPSLSLVLGSAACLSLVFGWLAYKRYADSEAYVSVGMEAMDALGPTVDSLGCVDAALEWHNGCEANDTNQAVCLHAVKIQMAHCLVGQDRAPACEEFTAKPEGGKWVQETCAERGQKCVNKRECGCAEAFRALQSFCFTGQKSVAM